MNRNSQPREKINPSVVRLQRLTDRISLYGQVQGQWSDGNLDSSEKISLGGAYGVRAYPEGEAQGDQGYVANVELRYALTEIAQLFTFVDHGEVLLNKDTWVRRKPPQSFGNGCWVNIVCRQLAFGGSSGLETGQR